MFKHYFEQCSSYVVMGFAMSKSAERKQRQRDALVDAAEAVIVARGLEGLKARSIAARAGCALGAIYNLVEDMDELALLVGSRTLARLDLALACAGEPGTVADAERVVSRLVAIAIAYCHFAESNLNLWRALFEHRMSDSKPVPLWATEQHMRLFAHVAAPLRLLAPAVDEHETLLLARTLFAAVHGVVLLGVEQKTVAVPQDALEQKIEQLVRLVCAGLPAMSR
jgi:AcrR family transcriptional regulator